MGAKKRGGGCWYEILRQKRRVKEGDWAEANGEYGGDGKGGKKRPRPRKGGKGGKIKPRFANCALRRDLQQKRRRL